jgi:hypothetical protein
MDPAKDFRVPTSQGLSANLKQQAGLAEAYKTYQNSSTTDQQASSVGPYEDGFARLGLQHYRKRETNKETTASTAQHEPKGPYARESVFDQQRNFAPPKHVVGKNFDGMGKNAPAARARTPLRCGHEHLETGAAHSSLRAMQHLRT